jgi:hypothetical protein
MKRGLTKLKNSILHTLFTASALVLGISQAEAATVDFTGAGTVNYETISQNYGDSLSANLSYRTLFGGNNWGSTATVLSNNGEYWATPNYSGDQAIYADVNGSKLEVRLDAAAGLKFTSIDFKFGSYPNSTLTTNYKVYDSAWSLLASADGFSVLGTGGALLSLALLNTTSVIIQFGDNWNVGLNSVSYNVDEIGAVSQVPVPGALVLFGSGVAGLLGYGARRKKAACAV